MSTGPLERFTGGFDRSIFNSAAGLLAALRQSAFGATTFLTELEVAVEPDDATVVVGRCCCCDGGGGDVGCGGGGCRFFGKLSL